MNPRFILVPSIDDIPKIRPKNAFYAHLDGADCPTSLALHQQLKQIFELPEYFEGWQLYDGEEFTPKNFKIIMIASSKMKLLLEENEIEYELVSSTN